MYYLLTGCSHDTGLAALMCDDADYDPFFQHTLEAADDASVARFIQAYNLVDASTWSDSHSQ